MTPSPTGASGRDMQGSFRGYAVPDAIRIRKVEGFLATRFNRRYEGLRVLELGVTPGGLADRLKTQGARCYGVDIHPREIDGVVTTTHDLNNGLPEFDAPFDVVFAGEVIEHVFDDAALVRACREVLKPGGLLISTTPNLAFLVNRFRLLAGMMPLFSWAPYHYHIYTARTLRSLLQENGFRVVRTRASHILFSTRRYNVGRVFEVLADVFPTLGAQIIMFGTKV